MSPSDFKSQRMSNNEVLKHVKILVKSGSFYYDAHAEQRMVERNLSEADIENVIMSPVCRLDKDPEFENGSWRYRLTTSSGVIVAVAFHSDGSEMVIISIFERKKSYE